MNTTETNNQPPSAAPSTAQAETPVQTAAQPKATKANRGVALFSLALIIIAVIVGSIVTFTTLSSRIYTDAAVISADSISLAPTTSGTLQKVYVNQGDIVAANTVVAQVGNELIKTTTDGIITTVTGNIGTIYDPGQAIVTMVHTEDLRVVAHIDENKGLDEIQVGQKVVFTVDAFGSKKYDGIVDEISPESRQNDVVFNISDKRETSVFDVKIRFDTSAYPELRNGMSAKVWIYTK